MDQDDGSIKDHSGPFSGYSLCLVSDRLHLSSMPVLHHSTPFQTDLGTPSEAVKQFELDSLKHLFPCSHNIVYVELLYYVEYYTIVNADI